MQRLRTACDILGLTYSKGPEGCLRTDPCSFETFKSKGIRHETEMKHNSEFRGMILNFGAQGCLTFSTEKSLQMPKVSLFPSALAMQNQDEGSGLIHHLKSLKQGQVQVVISGVVKFREMGNNPGTWLGDACALWITQTHATASGDAV